jgi:tRNA U34 2-thiouridine synthase MnmA/TrmU
MCLYKVGPTRTATKDIICYKIFLKKAYNESACRMTGKRGFLFSPYQEYPWSTSKPLTVKRFSEERGTIYKGIHAYTTLSAEKNKIYYAFKRNAVVKKMIIPKGTRFCINGQDLEHSTEIAALKMNWYKSEKKKANEKDKKKVVKKTKKTVKKTNKKTNKKKK